MSATSSHTAKKMGRRCPYGLESWFSKFDYLFSRQQVWIAPEFILLPLLEVPSLFVDHWSQNGDPIGLPTKVTTGAGDFACPPFEWMWSEFPKCRKVKGRCFHWTYHDDLSFFRWPKSDIHMMVLSLQNGLLETDLTHQAWQVDLPLDRWSLALTALSPAMG